MEIVSIDELQWWAPANVHREPGIEFKTLFRGEDGQPGNYWFTLVQVRNGYYAPRHRHNFEQIRYVLEGQFGFNEDQQQQAGTVGYFTEGTYYTQVAEGFSHTLLLQTEGASHTPYVSTDSFPAVAAELRKSGTFKDGKYHTQMDDKEVVQDGYEAVWERITGRKLSYVEPRYEKPVIMDPTRFAPTPVPDEPGVAVKKLGTFTERELSMRIVHLGAGATHRFDGGREGVSLAYVTKGKGAVRGKAWREGTGLRLTAEDTVDLTAETPAEIFFISLPK